jgi:hypothetical protein
MYICKECTENRTYSLFEKLGEDKTVELSAVECLDINLVILCIYRSPESNIDEFLPSL